MPKVSVIMGVFNCEKTIGKSIDSIIAQTFEDWEFIICDDGSADDTCKAVESYMPNEPRITLIRNNRNRGLSYTLNHCLEYVHGEYCARMDGDDVCDKARFTKQVEFLDNHPEYGFVSTTMKRFDEHGVYHCPEVSEPYAPSKKELMKGSPFCHAPSMLRRSAYQAVGGYRDIEKTRGVEDYDLWFRLFAADIKGCIINEPLYSMFDGRNAEKRRTFKRRINEAWVRKQGYKIIRIPYVYRIYILKPILIGLMPRIIYNQVRRLEMKGECGK